MQTAATKTMLKSLKEDAEKLEKSKKLVEGISNLREMGLLTGRDFHQTKYPGNIRHQHIYNDYHWRETNNGFSRNAMGGKFFTK